MATPVIDIHDFLDLDLLDQLIVLDNNGVLIGLVETKLLSSELYALGSFYVEVRLRPTGKAYDAVPFVKGPRLDKYLDAIDLTAVL